SPITSFAWGHASRTAVTVMQDGTLLVWDLAPETWPRGAAATKLDRKQLDRLWADLAGEDAARAHRAVGELTAAPGASAALLKEMLKPTAPPDKDQVSMLIANLDSNKFADRDAASKGLTRLRDEIEPILQRALSQSPSPETSRRIQAILSASALVPTGESLRSLRAVAVLEHIATPEARQLLDKLAGGAPQARLTREAKATLERLERR